MRKVHVLAIAGACFVCYVLWWKFQPALKRHKPYRRGRLTYEIRDTQFVVFTMDIAEVGARKMNRYFVSVEVQGAAEDMKPEALAGICRKIDRKARKGKLQGAVGVLPVPSEPKAAVFPMEGEKCQALVCCCLLSDDLRKCQRLFKDGKKAEFLILAKETPALYRWYEGSESEGASGIECLARVFESPAASLCEPNPKGAFLNVSWSEGNELVALIRTANTVSLP